MKRELYKTPNFTRAVFTRNRNLYLHLYSQSKMDNCIEKLEKNTYVLFSFF